MSEKFPILCAIHITKDYDIVVETYKRLNLVLYLVETFKK